MADSPEEHPWIGEDERIYIAKNTACSLSKTKVSNTRTIFESKSTTAVLLFLQKVPPYKEIFLSVPFWALVVLHFGNMWGVSLLLTSGPMFMSEALGFNIKKSGGLASLPYLARLIFGIIFGSIGDFLRKKNVMTPTVMRKSFVTFCKFCLNTAKKTCFHILFFFSQHTLYLPCCFMV